MEIDPPSVAPEEEIAETDELVVTVGTTKTAAAVKEISSSLNCCPPDRAVLLFLKRSLKFEVAGRLKLSSVSLIHPDAAVCAGIEIAVYVVPSELYSRDSSKRV